mgnify:CR=1 FL=1
MKSPIIIGTRGSKLALWQAHYTRRILEQLSYNVKLNIIVTKGDRVTLSFNKIEGKGFFTKEIEEALLNESIDLAVHSYKDLPTVSPDGLIIGANSYREDPSDWLIIKKDASVPQKVLSLKTGAVVGTSSARRKAQLLALRPDLQLKDIRGNVPTRLNKIGSDYDAVVLAAAGLKRLELDLSQHIVVPLSVLNCVPAPAQGVLAFQIRANDERMKTVVAHLNNEAVATTVAVERCILNRLGGGCQQPIGVYCRKDANNNYLVWASVAESWNAMPKRIFVQGKDPDLLVEQVLTALNDKQNKRIFISRAIGESDYFKRYLSHFKHEVYATSLLEFSSVTLNGMPQTDWVFFSSKNGVKYFVAKYKDKMQHLQLAVIGSGTQKALEQHGLSPHFVGTDSDDVATIAQQFATLAEGKKVLFPQAEQSMQTIQKTLGKRIHSINLVVYKNKIVKQFDIPPCDILVFTSPMNLQAYCNKYHIAAHQKIVAIGKSTAAALVKLGYNNYILPYAHDELSLADVCF